MTEKQIIKALTCCISDEIKACEKCPVPRKHKDDCECGRYLARESLKLIQKKNEEIGKYEKGLFVER